MWRVLSESGRLNAVLIQNSVESFWEKRLPFEGIESSLQYNARCVHASMEPGQDEWLELPKMLRDEGVEVFEVLEILKRGLGKATKKEKQGIIKKIWNGFSKSPNPEELKVEHLIYGYPEEPYFDSKQDAVVLPDFRRVAWPYSRDTSFTTQVGTVICNMRRYSRRHEPNVVKLAYELDPKLRERVEVVYDANEPIAASTEPPCVEGGDTQIVDDETIAIGVGQRSTMTGFLCAAEKLVKADRDGALKYIIAVQLPDYPAVDYMHLDVMINYPAKSRALVMPYVWDTEIIKDLPPKQLLMKTLYTIQAQSSNDYRPQAPIIHHEAFRNSGRASIYSVTKSGLEYRGAEVSFLDWLVKTGKLEKDGFMLVGGQSSGKNDFKHLYMSLMEQARGAGNVVAVKPGVVIAYKRNKLTIKELRDNGIRVKEWNDSHLDLLGGPHCSTSPLSRDA